MKQKQENKPLVESLINTVAMALTAYGVVRVTTGNVDGYLSIAVGVGLEWFKYWGRRKYW